MIRTPLLRGVLVTISLTTLIGASLILNGPWRADAAGASVAVMNLQIGKRNIDVTAYQRALRAHAPRVGVSVSRLNPSGATGTYGTQTVALTQAVYRGIARVTGNPGWATGDLRTPGIGLLGRLGLGVSRTPHGLNTTHGATEIITVEGAAKGSRTGQLVLWTKHGSTWSRGASYPARFGSHGLTWGAGRKQDTSTTPTGMYPIPFAFGTAANPGTSMPWRQVTRTAWWCEDTRSLAYNRWVDPLPSDCRAPESEHLITYRTYSYAALIGYNYVTRVKGRGAGIFLHVNGSGYTAGCISISESGMKSVLRWLTRARTPPSRSARRSHS